MTTVTTTQAAATTTTTQHENSKINSINQVQLMQSANKSEVHLSSFLWKNVEFLLINTRIYRHIYLCVCVCVCVRARVRVCVCVCVIATST